MNRPEHSRPAGSTSVDSRVGGPPGITSGNRLAGSVGSPSSSLGHSPLSS